MQIDEMTLNAGVIFERTYDILIDKMQNAVNRLAKGDKNAVLDAALLVSIAVNGSFASELYLKSILPDGTRGHALDKLYTQLPIEIQNEIKLRTVANMTTLPGVKKYSEHKFESDIVTMGNSFVDWRYFYQNNPKNSSPQFYKAFMVAIRTIVTEAKDGKEYAKGDMISEEQLKKQNN